MRGCTGPHPRSTGHYCEFPAHAGMYRAMTTGTSRPRRVPRACGDVPDAERAVIAAAKSSPRMRGCTGVSPRAAPADYEFPAHAGMYRTGRRLT